MSIMVNNSVIAGDSIYYNANNLFDLKLTDRILSGDEATGWCMQGTYTNSAHNDFYNKCIAEYNSNYTIKTLYSNQINSEYTIEGYPLLDKDNSYLSNLKDNNFITYNKSVTSYVSSTIYMRIKFSNVSGNEYLFNNLSQLYGIMFASYAGVPTLYASSNGKSWDFANGIKPTSSTNTWSSGFGDIFQKFETDTWYNIKIEINIHRITITINNQPCIRVTSDNYLYNNPKLGTGYCRFGDAWTTASAGNYTLDLKETYISDYNRIIDYIQYRKNNTTGHNFALITQTSSSGVTFTDFINEYYNNNLGAWIYGIDAANQRILLPKTRRIEQPIADYSLVNESTHETLPNIKGNYNGSELIDGSMSYNGAFTKGAISKSTPSVGGDDSQMGIGFDSSLSSSVYQDNAHVQPPTVQRLLYICVGNTTINTNYIDIAKEELVQQALSGVTTVTAKTNELLQQIQQKADQTGLTTKANVSLDNLTSSGYTVIDNRIKAKYLRYESDWFTVTAKSLTTFNIASQPVFTNISSTFYPNCYLIGKCITAAGDIEVGDYIYPLYGDYIGSTAEAANGFGLAIKSNGTVTVRCGNKTGVMLNNSSGYGNISFTNCQWKIVIEGWKM